MNEEQVPIAVVFQLEKENEELKEKVKILENRIASQRGTIRVMQKKLNARIEQVNRLKEEVRSKE